MKKMSRGVRTWVSMLIAIYRDLGTWAPIGRRVFQSCDTAPVYEHESCRRPGTRMSVPRALLTIVGAEAGLLQSVKAPTDAGQNRK